MAEKIGALLAPKATLCKESGYSFARIKDYPHRLSMYPGVVWVNKDGVRFCDESTAPEHANANLLVMQPGMCGYMLMDEALMQHLIYHPSPQVNNQFLRPGDPAIRLQLEQASTQYPELCCISDRLEDIARWIGADPAVLLDTIREYNSCCAKGHDPVFAKPPEQLKALTQPPYYAVKFSPLLVETIGPLVVNHHFQVLRRTDRKPIPGLYAGGAVTSGWQGHDYELWGANLSYGMASGRIAADHIAQSSRHKTF